MRVGLAHARGVRAWRGAVSIALALVLNPAACARPGVEPVERPVKAVLSPAELRVEVHRRVPELLVDDVPVLFAVSPDVIEGARAVMNPADEPVERIRRVVRYLMASDGLALVYDRGSLGIARETLEAGRGNCLSLAAVLVGIARGLGWRAKFTEMSLRDDEVIYEADVAIFEEHMGARLTTDSATLYIDYSGRMSVRSRVRPVSDMRATAQYYSNHAYELLHVSHGAGEPVPWVEVARRFEVATRIEPELAQAWNNLGVARSRLGDVEGAEVAYERAIAAGDRTSSAERNLRRLHGLPPKEEEIGKPGAPAGWAPLP